MALPSRSCDLRHTVDPSVPVDRDRPELIAMVAPKHVIRYYFDEQQHGGRHWRVPADLADRLRAGAKE